MEKRKIPFMDLTAGYKKIKPEIDQAIQAVFVAGSFILGKQNQQFEAEFAHYCSGAEQADGLPSKNCLAVGVGSGTEAIYLALRALEVQAGEEVITVSNTAIPTVAAIAASGAKPVLIDVHPDTYTMNPELIEEKINEKTRVILPVHLYGQPAEMKAIMEIAKRYQLAVIEDACQAHGALYQGQKVGTFGELGCFSFYPTKNLGAYGDGGMVTTSNESLYEKLKLLRNYGQKDRYISEIKGINSRLDEIQAAVLRVKLKYLDENNSLRRERAGWYGELLKAGGSLNLTLPCQKNSSQHNFHLYVISVDKRDELQKFLFEQGITTLIHYPIPVHLQPAYQDLKMGLGSLPVTEKLAKRILSLPMYPELTRQDLEYVAEKINAVAPQAIFCYK